jgi:heat shock protein HslJ
MTRILTSLLIIAISILGLTACNADTIGDTEWVLVQYGTQGDLHVVLEDTEITVMFDSNRGQANGSSGCNTYFSNYETSNNKLTISTLAWTEMACIEPEGIMEQEQQYLSILRESESYTIEGEELQISSLDGWLLIFHSSH